MPDFDFSLSASFISSKLGEKPVCLRCRSMYSSSSYCLRVSMAAVFPLGVPAAA